MKRKFKKTKKVKIKTSVSLPSWFLAPNPNKISMKKKITDFYSSSPPSIDMDILDQADNRRSPRLTPPPSPPVPIPVVPSSKSTSTPSSKSKSKITSYLPHPTVKHTKKKPVGRPPKKKKVRSLSIKNSASNSSPFDLTLTPTGRVKQVGVGSGNWRGGGVRKAPQAQTQVQVPAQAQGSPSRGGYSATFDDDDGNDDSDYVEEDDGSDNNDTKKSAAAKSASTSSKRKRRPRSSYAASSDADADVDADTDSKHPPNPNYTLNKNRNKNNVPATPPRPQLASSLSPCSQIESTLQTLLRRIRRRGDPYSFFSNPVTEIDAPGYFAIVPKNERYCLSELEADLASRRASSVDAIVKGVGKIVRAARAYNTEEGDFVARQAGVLERVCEELCGEENGASERRRRKIERLERVANASKNGTKGGEGKGKVDRGADKKVNSKKSSKMNDKKRNQKSEDSPSSDSDSSSSISVVQNYAPPVRGRGRPRLDSYTEYDRLKSEAEANRKVREGKKERKMREKQGIVGKEADRAVGQMQGRGGADSSSTGRTTPRGRGGTGSRTRTPPQTSSYAPATTSEPPSTRYVYNDRDVNIPGASIPHCLPRTKKLEGEYRAGEDRLLGSRGGVAQEDNDLVCPHPKSDFVFCDDRTQLLTLVPQMVDVCNEAARRR